MKHQVSHLPLHLVALELEPGITARQDSCFKANCGRCTSTTHRQIVGLDLEPGIAAVVAAPRRVGCLHNDSLFLHHTVHVLADASVLRWHAFPVGTVSKLSSLSARWLKSLETCL